MPTWNGIKIINNALLCDIIKAIHSIATCVNFDQIMKTIIRILSGVDWLSINLIFVCFFFLREQNKQLSLSSSRTPHKNIDVNIFIIVIIWKRKKPDLNFKVYVIVRMFIFLSKMFTNSICRRWPNINKNWTENDWVKIGKTIGCVISVILHRNL